jgi:uncharacterized protein (TIGR03435 family)
MNIPAQVAIAFSLTAAPVLQAQIAPQHDSAVTSLPSFEVATIKIHNPQTSGIAGFISYPGGRVLLGNATVRMIAYYAFDIDMSRITGGPDWVGTDKFDVVALPPDSSPSRTAKQPPMKATPSDDQRKMLQNLLQDRFGFQFHREAREGSVYILTRGSKKLLLEAPKDKDSDSRGAVVMKDGDIADGEAIGTNVSMPFLASRLSWYLGLPVLDQTGLKESYDFHLPPNDPTNTDHTAAVFSAMDRLGLELKLGKGPVDALVIDHVERPSQN